MALSPGGTINGWIAGPFIGVDGHMYPPFKPCYGVLTKDTVECPHCKVRGYPEWQGFLPIYNERGKPTVLVFGENLLDQVAQFKLHDAITASRGKDKFDGRGIAPWKGQTWYRATLPARQRAADIRQWLIFVLWKKETQLVNYYSCHPITNPLPVMEKAGPVASGSPPVNGQPWVNGVQRKMLEAEGHHEAAAKLPPTADQAFEEVQNRLKSKFGLPSKNGKAG